MKQHQKPKDPKRGAVNQDACPHPGHCRCGKCDLCGFQKHTGIHGPLLGKKPGSKPWGHEFKLLGETESNE